VEQRGPWAHGDVGPDATLRRIIAMYHIVHVGMNGEALKQLDDLRRAYPNIYNRTDLLLKLVAEAHEKSEKAAPAPLTLQLVA
jgi:hypothetical protein